MAVVESGREAGECGVGREATVLIIVTGASAEIVYQH